MAPILLRHARGNGADLWLVLGLGTAVGTFDSMDACQKAARTVWAEPGQAVVAAFRQGHCGGHGRDRSSAPGSALVVKPVRRSL